MGGALNVVFDAHTTAASFPCTTVLVRLARSVTTGALPRNTEAPERALPMVFALWGTSNVHQEQK